MVFQGAMNALNPVQEGRLADRRADGLPRRRPRARRPGAGRGELLELVGIPAAAGERYPHEFSGGMRQRAAIAMALACEPKMLLADEPTTALDVMVQAQILDLLTRLSSELGLALVLVTHDLPVVAQVCDRAAVMYAGEIVELGPIDALYHSPRTRTPGCCSPPPPTCTARTGSPRSRAPRPGWTGTSPVARSGRGVTRRSRRARASTRSCARSSLVMRPPATSPGSSPGKAARHD